jgi:hypothetical protein
LSQQGPCNYAQDNVGNIIIGLAAIGIPGRVAIEPAKSLLRSGRAKF